MPEQRSPLKEFRHLEEKLKTVGLSPPERARYDQLKEIVAPETPAPRRGFDVNAAAEALRASLEPAGLRRPTAEPEPLDLAAEPAVAPGATGPDPSAAAWDPNAQPYDPNAQPYDPNTQPYDPNAQPYDPNAQPYDPNAQPYDPNAQPYDPNAQPYDPNAQPYDPNAQPWDPNAQPYDPNAQPWDPNAQPWDPNQPYDPAAQGWDPNQPYDPSVPGYAASQPDASGYGDGGAAPLPDPGMRPSDLGPTAFDAAGLPPPESDPGYDQGRWDAVASGEPPDGSGAGWPQQGEPIEAELVDAEPIEAEPIEPAPAQPAESPTPGPDFFTPGPLTPDFSGAQPLDGATFGEEAPPPEPAGWPAAEAQPGEWAEAEPLAEEPQPAPAEQVFPLGGPGADQPGGASPGPEPISFDGQGETPSGAGEAEAVPLASPSEFLSPGPPPAEPLGALDLGDVPIEDLPPVEVDVEEIAEAPAPGAPAAAAAPVPVAPAAPAPVAPPAPVPVAAPAPVAATSAPAPASPPVLARSAPPPAPAPPRGQSPTFVAGEHRVVVHTMEGQVLRGSVADADLDAESLPLVVSAGAAPEPIAAARVKAIFFMLLPGGRPPVPEGHKVRVTFRDGRQVAGFSADYDPEAVGFFMVPADSRTNTGRIWVYRAAVRQVSVS